MLKERLTYEDFDGNSVTEDLYFNITKSELVDNLSLKTRFENLEVLLVGEPRELSMEETSEVLELVKTLIRIAYGIRSDDGKRFIKGEQIWTEFTQTMAYDAFLFSLFENPEKSVRFMVDILPKDLREEAQKVAAQSNIEVYKPPVDVPLPETVTPIQEKDPKDMTHEELLEAYKKKNQQR